MGVKMNERVVVFVGVLTEYQGIDFLLEAVPLVLQEVPQIKFLIMGYPNEQFYRHKAQALGIERWIYFTGKISYEELPRYLSLADVAVSPKISATEANVKLLNYMAMGLPTVVFDNPINREILGDVGIYAKMGDAESLAKALVGVLQNQEWAKQLGALSRKKAVDEHSWLRVGKRLGDIYNSIGAYHALDGVSKEQVDEQVKDIGHGKSRFHGLPFNK
jgi:glycosyltransferase involved in cell wall biosynthesis